MMEATKTVKADPIYCSVRDGLFVEPCSSLQSVIDVCAPSRARGVFKTELTNTTTWQPARSYVGVRSKQRANGFLFNFCPFCGKDISAPFHPAQTGGAA